MSRLIPFIPGQADKATDDRDETEADELGQSSPIPPLIYVLHRALNEIGYRKTAHQVMSMTSFEHQHICDALENYVGYLDLSKLTIGAVGCRSFNSDFKE